jgi:hypothetical protein
MPNRRWSPSFCRLSPCFSSKITRVISVKLGSYQNLTERVNTLSCWANLILWHFRFLRRRV